MSQCLHTELCEFAGWLRTQKVAQMLILPHGLSLRVISPWESLSHANNCSQRNHVSEIGTNDVHARCMKVAESSAWTSSARHV